MEYFYIYCLFASTTAFTAIYELVMPVFAKEAKIDSKYILYFTLWVLCFLAAPLVLFSCIIPEWGIRFRETLHKALFEEQKI